jgi:RNase P subunit RPR2
VKWECLRCGSDRFFVYANRPVGEGVYVVKCTSCGWKWFGKLIEMGGDDE